MFYKKHKFMSLSAFEFSDFEAVVDISDVTIIIV